MAPDAWTEAWIGLGANLGEPVQTLSLALRALRERSDCRAWRVSSPWRSAPIEATGPAFVNAVARCETTLEPAQLLAELHALERDHGRERPYHHAPRTLDLDLLLHGTFRSTDAALRLPHPRLHQRAFVLEPLLELAPSLSVPGLGSLQAFLSAVRHQSVQRLDGWGEPDGSQGGCTA